MKPVRLSLFALICLIIPIQILSQDYQSALSLMKEKVVKVTVREDVIEQSFSFEDNIVTIHVNNTADGKDLAYEFNAGDINEYKISFKTSKKNVMVTVNTVGNKKLIRNFENDVVKAYLSKFSFYASDVEAARALVDNFKVIVQHCTKEQENIGFVLGNNPGIDAALIYMTANTKKIAINEYALDQVFTYDNAYKALMKLEITDESEASTVINEFNVSDINHTTVDFDTRGERVFILGETKGERNLIKVYKNGELSSYAKKFEIYANSIEDARRLKEVFKYYVQEGEKLKSNETKDLANSQGLSAINSFISRHVKDVVVGTENYKQSFLPNSSKPFLSSLSVEDVNKGNATIYSFNMADLNQNNISFDTRGNKIYITLKSAGDRKLIKQEENGELQSYVSAIKLQAEGIEEARYIVNGLKKAIELSKEKQENSFLPGVSNPSKEQSLNFLKDAVVDVVIGENAFKQKFSSDAENNCIIQLEVNDVSKGETTTYRLNLGDINIHKTVFDTKMREVFVILETIGSNKLIEVQEEGVTEKFISKLHIRSLGVEEARKLEMAFEAVIRHCELK